MPGLDRAHQGPVGSLNPRRYPALGMMEAPPEVSAAQKLPDPWAPTGKGWRCEGAECPGSRWRGGRCIRPCWHKMRTPREREKNKHP